MTYETDLRKLFIQEDCRNGALPIFHKDDGRICYLIGEEGENIIAVSKPKRVRGKIRHVVRKERNPVVIEFSFATAHPLLPLLPPILFHPSL